MIRNRIKIILEAQGLSISELQRRIGKSYPYTHELVNRQDLGYTQLDTLVRVSKALEVDIQDLYQEKGE